MSVHPGSPLVPGVLGERPTVPSAPATATRTRARSIDRPTTAVLAATVLASVFLLALGRGLTFFADEWAVIADRPLGLDSFLTPFNEHWLGIQVTVFRALVETVGLSSYMPYLAVLVALHAIVALEVYVLARRATHPWLAVAITVVVLLFGSGFENLFWAMQIGFIGAIALGFGALLLLDEEPSPRAVVGATALLTAAIMTSGFGLFVLALVGLDLLVDPRRRRLVLATFVPAGIWLGWYLALGRAGVAAHGDPFSASALANVPSFVIAGLGSAVGGATGVGDVAGVVVGLVLVVVVAWRAMREGSPGARRALAFVGAIAAMYVLLGLVRSAIGVEAQYYTRYTYLSGMFALIALANLVGRRPMPAAPRPRLVATAVIGAAVALSLLWNVRLLLLGRDLFGQRAELTRALVSLALTDPLPAGVDASRDLVLVPSPDALRAIVAGHGSPLTDSLAGDAVAPMPASVRSDALDRAQHPPAFVIAGCIGSRPLPADCARFEGGG